MKRMHQEPKQLYPVYDYSNDEFHVILTIIDFVKTYGIAPQEINLYIPSLLLPNANDDIPGIVNITLTPCYPKGSLVMGTPGHPIYLGYQVCELGHVLRIVGEVDENDTLHLYLSDFKVSSWEDVTAGYIQAFNINLEQEPDIGIYYSVSEVSRTIAEIVDNYR